MAHCRLRARQASRPQVTTERTWPWRLFVGCVPVGTLRASQRERFSIHDMRRAISNWLKDEGISREVRDLVLNHLNPSVDGEHYSSSARTQKQVRSAMEMWARHVWEVTGRAKAGGKVVSLRRA